MILLGLFGGARAAAIGVIIAAALLVGLGQAPANGWPIELLAGAGSGFFYRVFAGARPA